MTPFHFKRFSIFQSGVAHPVGTDSVLLGAWAPVSGARRMLDIGTGTGVVALMLAQRSETMPEREITAVEPHPGSCVAAGENIARSPWAQQLRLIPQTIQDFAAAAQAPYDLIVSNPPFFSGTVVSPDPARRAARHTTSLSPGDLLDAAAALLAPSGRFCVILPPVEGQRLCEFGAQQGLYCTRRTVVYPRPGKAAERWLLQLERDPYPFAQDELFIYARAEAYSAEFKALTGAFYLGF